MTGFREQGSGIPLTLLHGISSGAASCINRWRYPATACWPGYARLWRKPDAGGGAGECRRLRRRAGANAGPRWSRANHTGRPFAGRAGGGRLRREIPAEGALPGARRRRAGLRPGGSRTAGKSLAGASTADSAGRRGDGPGRAAKLLRPGAREADVATVAAGMRRLRRDGYLAAAWMLAHDDIHRWLADYRGRLSVWCGEQDAITQPELVQGVALRYGAPYIAIPQAGHASYLDNEIFFNQQLLRIGEEVRDECTN